MKKILTVLGARPQFIKASVVSHALAKTEGLTEVLVHTGQHFDANMSDVFFSELGIAAPQHQLNVNGGMHGAMTGKMLADVEQVMVAERPDAVLVYGDTNSTLAGALAAVKLQIPVAHVEAGLRSFNMSMPEEVNRVLTDRVATWLFTPTSDADAHLRHEGVPTERIINVGDVMFDAALHYGAQVNATGRQMEKLHLGEQGYVLVTVHRAENTDDPQQLNAILDAVAEVSRSVPVVWPMHPRTRRSLETAGNGRRLPKTVHVTAPLGYLDMVQLEKYASLIATDSGGVQKEAFFYRVPCVTLRRETEWVELIEAGWNRLALHAEGAPMARDILAAVGSVGTDVQPYGGGQAARLIADHLSGQI